MALLCEAAFSNAPGVHILATSREPLRASGERVQRLPARPYPPTAAHLTAAEAMAFPAVELFVERVADIQGGFVLSDADAPIVAEICRGLDGIALAIELAASRVDAFRVKGLAAHLDERFRLLSRGRRTALARHRTLGAMLGWSYQLLSKPEREVLRRLSVFAGDFTLAGAEGSIAEADVVEHVSSLVSKSLISADIDGAVAHYRLLETTRAYAVGKLMESGEAETIAGRHAEFVRELFQQAESEWETRPAVD